MVAGVEDVVVMAVVVVDAVEEVVEGVEGVVVTVAAGVDMEGMVVEGTAGNRPPAFLGVSHRLVLFIELNVTYALL
jgi:hypothetical protein